MISKLFFLAGIIVCSASCETSEKLTLDEDPTVYGDSTIYGTWQLVEMFGGGISVGDDGFVSVDDGFKMTFNEDGSFSSAEFAECTEGHFQKTNNTITLVYGCENFTAKQGENPKGTLSYRYRMVNGKLELTPSNVLCYDGCASRFAKIDETIYGTWQLVEMFGGGISVGDDGFVSVDDGFKMTFNEDGSFSSAEFAECTEGHFQKTNNTITLVYGCENFTAKQGENPKGTLSYRYRMVNGKLELTPSNVLCYDGCASRFAKIDETIYGTWQLVASSTDIVPSDSAGFDYVEDGFKMTINEDGSFTSTEFAECTEGRFQTTNDTITFIYGCENFTAHGRGNPKNTLSYRYRMANGKLKMAPSNFLCYGGCVNLFAKIETDEWRRG